MTAEDTIERYATARYVVKEAREAKWARRIAVFFLQLLILTALLHRFFDLSTPAAINLIGVAIAGLALAVFIAVVSLVRIWFSGQTGAGNDFAALIVGLIGLALPVFFLSKAYLLPRLNDVETSPADPLQFTVLLEQRPRDANPLVPQSPEVIELQAEAYPDIGPMVVDRPAAAVFTVVAEAMKQLGWNVVAEEAPGESGVGRIEATDSTMIMGFTDDVVVRVKGDDTSAVIDIRSASRYGKHDFGTNAERVRAFYEEVNTALEKGEKTVLEQNAAEKKEEPVAAPAKDVKKKQKRQPRKRREYRTR
ncbi:MAG: DUF1499 domain-containing protein [Methyloceanibacter sp.]|uniref:DUF1499 domain-containing protein n=1 Tax=Methyloceanibacter sp. TaxID=1965321 RepID=UPI001DF494DB|nr:DUF1499 domain-containing protein [Methyloceanibacter sp.]MCB1442958.1 DUF1499 domain-containing protein [Methyloceanibacter sp.]MCC0058721.1 DUF1499 domain-containing protein [Hyphomicrobiaceae bacterium]